MSLFFIGEKHRQAFLEALKKADISADEKRSFQASLYVLTSVPALREAMDRFVNYQGQYILWDDLEQMNLSTGERIMAGIAMNVYNGRIMDGIRMNPADDLSVLDKDLRKVYLAALHYKFVA